MARRYRRLVPAAADGDAPPADGGSWRGPVLFFTGLLVVFALVVIAFITLRAIAGATDALGREPSAVQIIQVYAEGCFYAITAIGIGIAVYIASHAGD
jgi:hypothetical protein